MQRMIDIGAIEPGRTDCGSSGAYYIDTLSKTQHKARNASCQGVFCLLCNLELSLAADRSAIQKTMLMLCLVQQLKEFRAAVHVELVVNVLYVSF